MTQKDSLTPGLRPARIAEALESLMWPNMSIGNKAVIKAAIGALLAAEAKGPVTSDAATSIRACIGEFPESVHDIVEECAAIAENATRTAPQVSQPVQVPEDMPKGLAGQIVGLLAHNIGDKFLAQKIWNACRAAMLKQPSTIQASDSACYGGEIKQPASKSLQVPDGWKLVPVEPTREMREAFHAANEEAESGDYDVWSPDHQWQAMLAAAPQPGSE